jgi:GNAT superfamily N-acetyltransferase
VLRRELGARLAGGGAVWLAEDDGRAVGVLDGGLVYAAPGSTLADLLPLGVWGAVHHCGVVPGARGSGVGRSLVEHAHDAWSRAAGAVLHFHPANPLSSVFWPRRGYRPLWTTWEHRPRA